jgi:hypothetical protein
MVLLIEQQEFADDKLALLLQHDNAWLDFSVELLDKLYSRTKNGELNARALRRLMLRHH